MDAMAGSFRRLATYFDINARNPVLLPNLTVRIVEPSSLALQLEMDTWNTENVNHAGHPMRDCGASWHIYDYTRMGTWYIGL